MTRRRGTHEHVAAVLADGPKTAYEIAEQLNSTFDGITACLRGMRNRKEVVRLKPAALGKPCRYRLREGACN
ncbi:MAG TPA: hypothetical protein VGU03_11015 [Frateuria sp.]|uniref:hypothetical protein n=1 Tax=Frateuria sp. TaxID=2211372 RepID=UPI002DE31334|nr:hypothetical protein [Frateuria sp.]